MYTNQVYKDARSMKKEAYKIRDQILLQQLISTDISVLLPTIMVRVVIPIVQVAVLVVIWPAV